MHPTLDVAERVVEVGRGGREVRVRPRAVAEGEPAAVLEGRPEVAGIAQPPRAHSLNIRSFSMKRASASR
jgi:hypothetical protein